VRDDFADLELGREEEACECNLCWGENFASIRALHSVAAPGMTEQELALAAWEWMHAEGPWAWKRRRP
jgi:hypothetical protein